MAGNSTSCKIQCIVLVTGIVVLTSQKDTTAYALLGLVPTVMFLFLDAYYLALEQGFRCSYRTFVDKLHCDEISLSDLYVMRPASVRMLVSLGSMAIWPFYTMLAAAILLVWKFNGITELLGL
jgi:hypothetical protein